MINSLYLRIATYITNMMTGLNNHELNLFNFGYYVSVRHDVETWLKFITIVAGALVIWETVWKIIDIINNQ